MNKKIMSIAICVVMIAAVFAVVAVTTNDNSIFSHPRKKAACMTLLQSPNPRLLWSFPTDGEVNSVTSIDDVSNPPDGIPDVLAGSKDGKVYCIDGKDGTEIWSYDTRSSFAEGVTKVSCIDDINNDGSPEALAIAPHGLREIYCIEGDSGIPIWSMYFGGNRWDGDIVVIDDISSPPDGIPDVVFAFPDDECGYLYFDIYWLEGSDGMVIREFSRSNFQEIEGYLTDVVSIPDIDAGGKRDVVIGFTNRYKDILGKWYRAGARCYSSESAIDVWSFEWEWKSDIPPSRDDPSTWTYTTCTGIITDTPPKVLVGEKGSNRFLLHCLDGRNGIKIGGLWPRLTESEVVSTTGINSDALIGTESSVHCFRGSDGNYIWSYNTGSWTIVDAVGDVNYNAISDAIVGTSYSSSPKGVVRCVEGDSPPSALSLWTYKIENGHVLDLTSIDDISSPPDGIPDVLVGASDNKVYALSGIGASPGVDVFIRDCPWDDGSVSSSAVCENGWIHLSPDIWVTADEGGTIPLDNPILDQDNYLWSRVWNIGTKAATSINVEYFWADYGVGLEWRSDHFPNGNTDTISNLPPGGFSEQCIKWHPKKEDGTEQHTLHRCIFVRLGCSDDPYIYPKDTNLENNIGWKNFVVQTKKGYPEEGIWKGEITEKVRNADPVSRNITVHFYSEDIPLFWEILVEMDGILVVVLDSEEGLPAYVAIDIPMSPYETKEIKITSIAPIGTKYLDTTITSWATIEEIIDGAIEWRPIGGATVKFIIDTIPPVIEKTKPKEGYLYIFDGEIMPIGTTLIIGPITIEIEASDIESGMAKVEFYVDDVLRNEDTTYPYKWLWDETVFCKHKIKVVAYDNAENVASDEQVIWIFNI